MIRITLFIATLSTAALGQAAYLDAEGGPAGNTVRAADGDASAWWSAAMAPDGVWARRTGFANNPDGLLQSPASDVFEASGTDSGREDAALIVTTVSGLTPAAVYRLSVIYWSSNSQNWSVRAGFDENTVAFFDRTGDNGAAAGQATGRAEGDRNEYSGLLGETAADANGQIKVYINDKPSSASQGAWYDRTWYDGIVYEAVDDDPTPKCEELKYDFSGPQGQPDCKVDLYDLAQLAAQWLVCTLIPETDC